MSFLTSIDDTLYKSLQDSMMMSHSSAFKNVINPVYSQARKRDQTVVVESWGLYFGRYRTVIAMILALVLWTICLSIALSCATANAYNLPYPIQSNPFDYFEANSFFQAVGGINFCVFVFCALSMFRNTRSSVLNILQLACALIWVFVLFFKVIMWGLLAWPSDVALYRKCDCTAGTCETDYQTIARMLAAQMRYHTHDQLREYTRLQRAGTCTWTGNPSPVAVFLISVTAVLKI